MNFSDIPDRLKHLSINDYERYARLMTNIPASPALFSDHAPMPIPKLRVFTEFAQNTEGGGAVTIEITAQVLFKNQPMREIKHVFTDINKDHIKSELLDRVMGMLTAAIVDYADVSVMLYYVALFNACWYLLRIPEVGESQFNVQPMLHWIYESPKYALPVATQLVDGLELQVNFLRSTVEILKSPKAFNLDIKMDTLNEFILLSEACNSIQMQALNKRREAEAEYKVESDVSLTMLELSHL